MLLINDQTGLLPVIVSGVEAICFLQNMEPKEAFSEAGYTKMCQILERLWTMKEVIHEAQYFECLVQSYTVELHGKTVKRYKLFNTSISKAHK